LDHACAGEDAAVDFETLRPWELYDAIVELPDGVSEL
jgi:hypothetical protein